MVQDADGQNCRCRLICRLNISSESASATACRRAFQAGMVRGSNAYLNASTVGWKRWNCLGWPLAEFCGRGTGWYSCGTSPNPFVILFIMVSLLWSLRVCRGSHPRSDTIADTETGGLLRSVVFVGLSVCLVIVRAIKGKRLKLSTPNLVHTACTDPEVKRSRSRGYENRHDSIIIIIHISGMA